MSRAINFQTVSWFWDLYTRGLLDLEPPYQRRSVWNQEYKDFWLFLTWYAKLTIKMPSKQTSIFVIFKISEAIRRTFY